MELFSRERQSWTRRSTRRNVSAEIVQLFNSIAERDGAIVALSVQLCSASTVNYWPNSWTKEKRGFAKTDVQLAELNGVVTIAFKFRSRENAPTGSCDWNPYDDAEVKRDVNLSGKKCPLREKIVQELFDWLDFIRFYRWRHIGIPIIDTKTDFRLKSSQTFF